MTSLCRAALCLLLLPTIAAADDKAAKAKAAVHADRAATLYGENKFAEALNELTLAYALDPDPQLLYAIGQIHVKLGHCPEAITFYERFLATKPAAGEVNVVKQAIEACKSAPPVVEPKPPDEIKPPPPPPPPRTVTVTVTAPWYTDVLGDVLLGSGIVGGVVGGVLYGSSSSLRDDADKASTYDEHLALVDDAKARRTLSLVVCGAGVALIAAGVIRFAVGDRRDERQVAFVPATGGGVLAFGASF